MKIWNCLLPVVMITVLALPSFGQKADPEAGKAIFAKRCATCHGAAGEGKEQLAKMLKVEIRDLGSKEVQAHNDAELAKIIRAGKGKMKPVKEVTDKDLPNLTAYLRALAHKH